MNLIYCPACNHLLQIDLPDWVGQGWQRCLCGQSWGKQETIETDYSLGQAFCGGRAIAVHIDNATLAANREESPDLAHGLFYLPWRDDPSFTRVDDEQE